MNVAAIAVFAMALAWAGTDPSDTLTALQTRFESVSDSYDIAAVEELLTRARMIVESQPSSRAVELEVRACLLVAELERLAFERLPSHEREARSKIGKRIDAAAKAALERAETLPESSERWRLRADLLATMIRSDFRAKKYHKAFEQAVDHARRLDPENPHAWVTAAKPLVFAGPKRGQDFDEAVRLLDRALDLEPGLESALLLRGLAEERRGAPDRAAADWRIALDANPRCEPAREGLERVDGPTSP